MTLAAATDAEIPEDMRWPSGTGAISLDLQLAAARAEYHRYVAVNAPKAERERGHGAMHPDVYRRGRLARLAIYHSLLQLKQMQAPAANDRSSTS